MWRDIRPGGQLSARELNDLADMAEGRIVGVGTGEASNNSVTISRTPTGQAIGFDAPEKLSIKITSASGTGTGGSACYTWTEVYLDATSTTWTTVGDGRTGTLASLSARERSGDTSVILNSIVEATLDDSGEFYLFDAPGSATTSAYKIAAVATTPIGAVRPSYGTVSVANADGIMFAAEDGFRIDESPTGTARVWLAPADLTRYGSVSTAAQSFAGAKTFKNGVTVGDTTLGTPSVGFQGTTASASAGSAILNEGNPGSYSSSVSITNTFTDGSAFSTSLYIKTPYSGDAVARIIAQNYTGGSRTDVAYALYDSTNTLHTGAYASVSGLVFKGGLYISGSLSIDELAQDAVGAMVADTDTINVTYTDATPELKWDVRYQMSITSDASGIKLSGDATSPGNNYFYGTNGAGTKGWYATSTISGTLDINGLTADDIAVADAIPFYDDSGADNNKITVKRLAGYVNPGICDFRLSPQTGVAVYNSDYTSITTLYMVPHLDANAVGVTGSGRIALYDGTRWNLHLTAEISLALTMSADTNYDVFVYDNSGTVTLELSAAWASSSTRTDSLALQDGVLVKSGSTTRRYMGTIRCTSSANNTEDSATKRFIWNMYHRVSKHMLVTEGTNNWTYGSATWRSANNSTANRVEFVLGLPWELVNATVLCLIDTSVGVDGIVGIGLSSTSSNSAQLRMEVTNADGCSVARYCSYPGQGYYYLQWLEYSRTGTPTYIGDGGTVTIQSGLTAEVWC